MPIRLATVLLFVLTSLSISAQVEVLVEFASAKTLVAAKEKIYSSASRPSSSQTTAPVWHTLQSSGERNIAVVNSSRSLSDWDETPGIISVRGSQPLAERTRTPNDPSFPDQWDMEKIEAPAAWEYTTGGTSYSGRKIVVGVIEFGGMQLDHPELKDNIYVNAAEVPEDGIDNDNNGLVDDVSGWNYDENQNFFTKNSHGTKVLGTLGAKGNNNLQAAGVNWDISMIPFQVGNDIQWVLALDYLTTMRRKYNESNGAEGAYIVAANMSLGFQGSGTCDIYQHLNDAFTRAGEQGVLCIGASSNVLENLDRTPDISSNCSSEYLIVVTASTREDDIWRACGYSTTDVDIAAPGETYRTIAYTATGSTNDDFEDTSGATPHVTGAVALAYAIACPTLDEIALIDPAGAALIVKDAILSTGDDAVGNAALSTSGKRLNVRRVIERLLEEDCLLGDMIVQLEDGQIAPVSFTDAAGELNLVRTLSDDWNIHLYNTSGGAIAAHITQLEAMPSVLAAEPNIRMILRGRQPNDPGYPTQDNLDVMGVDDAWETIYGASGTPPPSRVVTAIFDQNFDLSSPDITGRVFVNPADEAGNGIDDDGNGYVDDNSGYNLTTRSSTFSAGNHGLAVASIIAANADDGFGIAGIDWAGQILPLQGNSLGQWIEGAYYVSKLRAAYNRSEGANGALVISYVTPQGGTLIRQGGELIPNVLDSLLSTGVLAIGATVNDASSVDSDFPTSIEHDGLLNTAYGFIGSFDGDVRSFSENNKPLYLPSDNTSYALTTSETLSLSGSSAASALAAGSFALLYQAPCQDFETQAYRNPSATATRLKRALYRSVGFKSNYRNDLVQLDVAAQQCVATCSNLSSDCKVVSLFPNPISSEGSFKIELVAGLDKSTCPVSIYDVLGRIVFRQNVSVLNGYREVELPSAGYGLGLYFLTSGEGKKAESYPFVRSK